MPVQLLRRVSRERRRISLVMALCTLGVAVAGAPGGLPGWVFVPLAGLASAALALAFPRARSLAEAGAMAWLALLLLAPALPGNRPGPGAGDDPLTALAAWICLAGIARWLRYGLLSLPGPVLTAPRFKVRAGSRADIFRLWYGLVPAPGTGPRCGDPDCAAVEGASTAPASAHASAPGPGQPVSRGCRDAARVTSLHILEADPPFHIRLSAREETRHGVTQAGMSEIFFADLGDRRLVLFSHTFPQMALGTALLAWLDDSPGRLLDRRLASIEHRTAGETAGEQADRTVPTACAKADTVQTAFAEWRADAARDAADSTESTERDDSDDGRAPGSARSWRQAS